MYSRTTSNQKGGYGGDAFSEERDHKGTVISISIPFHEQDLLEEMDLQARLELCSSRSHYIRRLIRKGRTERLKAEQQIVQWSEMFGRK